MLQKGVKEVQSQLKKEAKTTALLQFVKILFTEKLWKFHEPTHSIVLIIQKARFHKIKITWELLKWSKRNITPYSLPAVSSFYRLQIRIVVRPLLRFKILKACSNHLQSVLINFNLISAVLRSPNWNSCSAIATFKC